MPSGPNKFFLHELLVALDADLFQQVAQQDVSRVAVAPLFARLEID
jgi:hypothetical protein